MEMITNSIVKGIDWLEALYKEYKMALWAGLCIGSLLVGNFAVFVGCAIMLKLEGGE